MTRNISLAFFLSLAITTRVVHAQQFDENGGVEAPEGPSVEAIMAYDEETDFLSQSTLEQVHVITRHGSRTMLSRDADTLAEEGGASLTPMGQKQLFDLGAWLRERYLDVLGGPAMGATRSLAYYNPSLHRLESSNNERSLSSANALALGLFPLEKRASGTRNIDPSDPLYEETVLFESLLDVAPAIPVYTVGSEKNDITLMNHKNCPTFHDRLTKDLYPSDEWKKMEIMHDGLLVKLATFFPHMAVRGKIPLKDVHNAYDAIHVWRTECSDLTTNCSPFLTPEATQVAASALTTEDFETLETLTEHIEFLKFGAGLDTDPKIGTITAGALLGSNLLWKILHRSKGDGNFFLYSAHSPTLLGLLATLEATTDFYRDTEGEKFFDYGSALIVEIHKSTNKGKYFFVLKYKATENTTGPAVNVVMRESTTGIKCGMDDGSGLPFIPKASLCMLDEVITWAKINTLSSEAAWCKACNNREADVCLVKKRGTPKLDAWVASSESMGYTGSTEATFVICSLFFGGFGAGIFLMGLVWWFNSRGPSNNTASKGKNVSEDDPTNSYGSDDNDHVKDGIIVIENTHDSAFINGDDDSAEKLNDKEIC